MSATEGKGIDILSLLCLNRASYKDKTNMSILNYLQLQPVEPTDDGTVSPLDDYQQDDTIDLTHDEDGEELMAKFDQMMNDPEFSSDTPTDEK